MCVYSMCVFAETSIYIWITYILSIYDFMATNHIVPSLLVVLTPSRAINFRFGLKKWNNISRAEDVHAANGENF